eukprot:6467467-Amphidinium_carterae.1
MHSRKQTSMTCVLALVKISKAVLHSCGENLNMVASADSMSLGKDSFLMLKNSSPAFLMTVAMKPANPFMVADLHFLTSPSNFSNAFFSAKA